MKYKHDPNKVLEACAEVLKNDMGFNPKQVLRFFMLFPLAGYEDFLDVPSKDYENWYELKGRPVHIKLLFNYVTKEYILLYPESDWKGYWMEHLKKTEEELERDEELYAKRMEEIRETRTFEKIKPVIKWYFAKPLKFISPDNLPPIEYINMLLKNHHRYFYIDEGQDIEKLTMLYRSYKYF